MDSKQKICPFCEEVFNVTEIKDHIGIAHLSLDSGDFKEDTQFMCVECSTHFISEISLERHKKFSHSKVEEIHEKEVHRGEQIQCPKCTKTFAQPSGLRYHLETFHEGCLPAAAKKRGRPKSVRHNQIDIRNQRWKCQQCHHTFATYSSRRQHVRSIHKGLRLQCTKCTKSFTQHNNLIFHMRSVHDGILLKCPRPDCKTTFTRNENLQKHLMSVHDGIRHECSQCDKSFVQKNHLRAHVEKKHQSTQP